MAAADNRRQKGFGGRRQRIGSSGRRWTGAGQEAQPIGQWARQSAEAPIPEWLRHPSSGRRTADWCRAAVVRVARRWRPSGLVGRRCRGADPEARNGNPPPTSRLARPPARQGLARPDWTVPTSLGRRGKGGGVEKGPADWSAGPSVRGGCGKAGPRLAAAAGARGFPRQPRPGGSRPQSAPGRRRARTSGGGGFAAAAAAAVGPPYGGAPQGIPPPPPPTRRTVPG
ncbi:hypothetical protein chiPu_0027007, partial [Chiloscyllium punctatum]|nr:hypothetical protein [Chiloscyllium punctatum]